eukprot:PhM_4_TR2184/c0_g1_i1/m.98071
MALSHTTVRHGTSPVMEHMWYSWLPLRWWCRGVGIGRFSAMKCARWCVSGAACKHTHVCCAALCRVLAPQGPSALLTCFQSSARIDGLSQMGASGDSVPSSEVDGYASSPNRRSRISSRWNMMVLSSVVTAGRALPGAVRSSSSSMTIWGFGASPDSSTSTRAGLGLGTGDDAALSSRLLAAAGGVVGKVVPKPGEEPLHSNCIAARHLVQTPPRMATCLQLLSGEATETDGSTAFLVLKGRRSRAKAMAWRGSAHCNSMNCWMWKRSTRSVRVRSSPGHSRSMTSMAASKLPRLMWLCTSRRRRTASMERSCCSAPVLSCPWSLALSRSADCV